MRAEAEPWWRQAQADMETARQTLAGGRYYAASWFAQQATEKGLKMLFIERNGTLPPRTHDLEYLGTQLQIANTIATHLATLNPAFDLSRYPDPIGQTAPVDAVSKSIARTHVAAAERIMEWLNTELDSE